MARKVLVQDTDSVPVQQYLSDAKAFYAQDTDPGAVGTGSVWKDTSVAEAYKWWERNLANDGWDPIFSADVEANTAAVVVARLTATNLGAGNAISRTAATTDGAGDALASPTADATGTGNAAAAPTATAAGGGNATVKAAAFASGVGIATGGSAAEAFGSGAATIASTATTDSGDADAIQRAIAATGTATAGSLAVRGAQTVGMRATSGDGVDTLELLGTATLNTLPLGTQAAAVADLALTVSDPPDTG